MEDFLGIVSEYVKKNRLDLSDSLVRGISPELIEENLFRLIVLILLLIFMESFGSVIFMIFKPSYIETLLLKHNLRYIYIPYFLLSVPYLILCIYFYRNSARQVSLPRKAFIYSFFFFTLMLGVLMAVFSGEATAYAVALLLISGLFCMLPRYTVILYSLVYLFWWFLLPVFIPSGETIIIFRIEMFVINLIAILFNWQIFRARVQIYLDRQKILEQNEKLEQLSILDSMTRLYNHQHSYDLLNNEVVRSARYNLPLAVLLLDIDHFKKVNDTYGHQAGDRVLKTVAAILKDNTRASDIVGRYGGEEFIVVMPDTNLEHAFDSADRLRKKLESHDFQDMPAVTISGGVVEYHGESAVQLVDSCDQLLYQAKGNGRNRIETVLAE